MTVGDFRVIERKLRIFEISGYEIHGTARNLGAQETYWTDIELDALFFIRIWWKLYLMKVPTYFKLGADQNEKSESRPKLLVPI